MAVVAKMACNEVSATGGGTSVPLCMAHDVVEAWPPEINHGTIYGHGEGECARCDELTARLVAQDKDWEGARIAYLPGKGSERITLGAVMSGGPDDPNAAWAAATPSGMLELQIDNPKAWGFFDPGAEYIVKITRHVPARARQAQGGSAA